MGKRSDFARIDRDYYPTPAAAVAPLIPHLPRYCTYMEPCVGDGALVAALNASEGDKFCVWESDIEPRVASAIKLYATALSSQDTIGADYIITNPPWSRPVLHEMIVHFSDLLPTWLLFDADWVHTKQSAAFIPRLRKVVSVGRVKWFPDSPHTGKDNCAWHLFDKPSDVPAEFYGRAA